MAVKLNFSKHDLLSIKIEYQFKTLSFVFFGFSIRIYNRSYYDLYNSWQKSERIEASTLADTATDALMDFFTDPSLDRAFLKYVKSKKIFKREVSDLELTGGLFASGNVRIEGEEPQSVNCELTLSFPVEYFNNTTLKVLKESAILAARNRELKIKEEYSKLKWYQKLFGYRNNFFDR